jgi:hypothetical protein
VPGVDHRTRVGLPAVYGTAYFARHGEVWYFLGFPTYGDGPFEAFGVPTSVPLLTGFATVCAAEAVTGILLWKRRRVCLWLSLALLPLEAAYWLGRGEDCHGSRGCTSALMPQASA